MSHSASSSKTTADSAGGRDTVKGANVTQEKTGYDGITNDCVAKLKGDFQMDESQEEILRSLGGYCHRLWKGDKTVNNQVAMNVTGPPGTGKTRTLALAVAFVTIYFDQVTQVTHPGEIGQHRVIVVAEKNAVVDNVAEVIDNVFQKIDYKATQLGDTTTGPTYNRPLVRVGNFNLVTSEQVKVFHADHLEDELARFRYPSCPKQMLPEKETAMLPVVSARVVFSTIDGILTALKPLWHKGGTQSFQFMFIEEASSVSRFDLIIANHLSIGMICFFGDLEQLGIYGKEQMGPAGAFNVSPLELFKHFSPDAEHRLRFNHRSVPAIMAHPAEYTYQNELVYIRKDDPSAPIPHYRVFNYTASCEVDVNSPRPTVSLSTSNPSEGRFLLKLLEDCLGKLLGSAADTWGEAMEKTGFKIGIITPYTGQVDFLKREIEANFPKLKLLPAGALNIQTVDSSQSQEFDLVLVSTVRTQQLGFLSDNCRLNVMLTRAKDYLFVVCNSQVFDQSEYLTHFLDNARKRQCLITVDHEDQASALAQLANTVQ